jgi:hypothetical protein
VEGRLEAPKHLARTVHDLYFEPKYEEFRPRTIWSLSNAGAQDREFESPLPDQIHESALIHASPGGLLLKLRNRARLTSRQTAAWAAVSVV